METKRVRDLMLTLNDYATVSQDASLVEALRALEQAQVRLPPERQPHRAVLIVDDEGRVVGKIGQLGFLKALEPKYSHLGDLHTLSRAGLSTDFLNSMMENLRLWSDSMSEVCRRARLIRVKDAMTPVAESIDEDAPITEAIHTIVVRQTLSILVTRGEAVVGILRLSDLFTEVAESVRASTE